MTSDPVSSRSDSGSSEGGALVSLLVVLFAVCNFLGGPIITSAGPRDPIVLGPAFVGAIGAQLGLHAIWSVLAPVSLVQRTVVAMGSGLILFVALVLGFAAAGAGSHLDYWKAMGSALLCLPLLLIAIQSPLWIARCWFGWRILHRRDPLRRSGFNQMGIRDILIATGVVAMALSAARLAVPGEFRSPAEFLVPLVIGAMVGAVVSLLTTLPVVAATLRARRVGLAISATLLLELAVVVGLLVIGSMIVGSGPPAEAYVGFASLLAGFFVCLTGVMLIVRRLGFRLYWGRRGPRPTRHDLGDSEHDSGDSEPGRVGPAVCGTDAE